MKVIHKYPLEVTEIQSIILPKDAEILSIQEQYGNVCLWALVNPDLPLDTERTILTIATGRLIASTDEYKYITTCQVTPMAVFHYFEHIKPTT